MLMYDKIYTNAIFYVYYTTYKPILNVYSTLWYLINGYSTFTLREFYSLLYLWHKSTLSIKKRTKKVFNFN